MQLTPTTEGERAQAHTVESLLRENDALRLQLFWKDHNDQALQQLMIEANLYGFQAPRCACLSCRLSGRAPDDEEAVEGERCRFKAWFEPVVAGLGLTVLTGVAEGMEQIGMHVSCSNPVYDVECHFHHLVRADWFAWNYGSALWAAESVESEDLRRLETLFRVLNACIEDGPVGSNPT
jgi:hypothetical protein